jgi:hypothetical protein
MGASPRTSLPLLSVEKSRDSAGDGKAEVGA